MSAIEKVREALRELEAEASAVLLPVQSLTLSEALRCLRHAFPDAFVAIHPPAVGFRSDGLPIREKWTVNVDSRVFVGNTLGGTVSKLIDDSAKPPACDLADDVQRQLETLLQPTF